MKEGTACASSEWVVCILLSAVVLLKRELGTGENARCKQNLESNSQSFFVKGEDKTTPNHATAGQAYYSSMPYTLLILNHFCHVLHFLCLFVF